MCSMQKIRVIRFVSVIALRYAVAVYGDMLRVGIGRVMGECSARKAMCELHPKAKVYIPINLSIDRYDIPGIESWAKKMTM